ncbi:MAG: TonB-dependent receptor plug domain-containing protein, partial [Chloroherpetonaceae bacterium]
MFRKMTLFFCGLLITSFSIFAEENDTTEIEKTYYLPSITVSTNRVIESKSPVPFSIITESEISKSYIYQDLPDLLSALPSIYSYSQNGNSIGYSNLSLRGFEQRRISVLINGIPQNDPEDHDVYWIDFPDLSSNLGLIEVQRGGGLTSYGPPAIGGTINLSTTNFVNQRGIKIYAGGGFQEFGGKGDALKQNVSKYSIEASSGYTDGYAFYGRLSRINSFGYRDHSWVTLNSYFLSAARFGKNVTTQINVFGGPISDGLSYTGIPKEYITDKEKRLVNYNYWEYDSTGKNVSYSQTRRNQEVEEFSQPHYEMLNDVKISDNLQLLSSLFLYTGAGYFDYDATGWTNAQMFQLTAKNGYPDAKDPLNPIIRAYVGNKQVGWIPRLLWKHTNGDLLTGFELRIHRS